MTKDEAAKLLAKYLKNRTESIYLFGFEFFGLRVRFFELPSFKITKHVPSIQQAVKEILGDEN